MGRGVVGSHDSSDGSDKGLEEDFDFLERDITRSMVNGVPSIEFSDRFQQLLVKEMVTTVVVKLLGRNIGYNALQNKIINLWKSARPFKLIDAEHGYYLPWTLDFNSLQPYPSVIMTWIRLLGLPGFLYKRKILEEISGLISRVVKLDSDTDNRSRGKFARMSVFMNLDKPLIPQVLVNGRAQRAEYEALISTQLEAKSGKANSSTLGDLQKESINLEQ
ncbi:hypothetical protein GOBAR_AA24609 [Gossypium barbadense]|uniref:Uncharacterized protein n=1 Tax=Gossypium barbadense TaxID=3634 RepID=A0A2P5WYA7_GOSBA|nr:hypothetical protein GOBAR_AA24609 [Gossypium barbadense]